MNIQPPPGYALLDSPDEPVLPGDIFNHDGEWEAVVNHVGNVRFWTTGENKCAVARKTPEFAAGEEEILSMDICAMCSLYRFAPVGHPFFDSSNPLSTVFTSRFKELGRFSPEISKEIGW